MKLVLITVFILGLLFVSWSNLSAGQTVTVRIEGKGETIFKGSVDINDDCIFTDNKSQPLEVNEPMAVCALEAVSKKAGFNYSVENQSLGLFLQNIAGKNGDWRYWVNKNFARVGIGDYKLNNNDYVVFALDTSEFPEEKVPEKPKELEKPQTSAQIINPAPPKENPTVTTPIIPRNATQIQNPSTDVDTAKQSNPTPANQPSTNQPAQTVPTLQPSAIGAAVLTQQPKVVIPEPEITETAVEDVQPVKITKLAGALPKTGPEDRYLYLGPLLTSIGLITKKFTKVPLARLLRN